MAQLAGMMAAVGRGGAVQKLYISARTPPIQVKWSSYTVLPPSRGGGRESRVRSVVAVVVVVLV